MINCLEKLATFNAKKNQKTLSSEKNKQGTTAEWRSYVSSHEVDNNKPASCVWNHWPIESEHHWELDVHLNDDADKKHDKIAATNFFKDQTSFILPGEVKNTRR